MEDLKMELSQQDRGRFLNGACAPLALAIADRLPNGCLVTMQDQYVMLHVYVRPPEGGMLDGGGYYPDEAVGRAKRELDFPAEAHTYVDRDPEYVSKLIDDKRFLGLADELRSKLNLMVDEVIADYKGSLHESDQIVRDVRT